MKNDNTPSVISGGGGSPKSLPPDATPTPPSSLNIPRDRRPLSARGSNNSDSIEDYLKNWKKNENGASPELHSPGVESIKSNNSSIPSNKDVEVVKSSLDSTLANINSKSSVKPPVLSPKPNPDLLVKRFSFNKQQKQENDSISTNSSTFSSPAVDRSAATTTNNVVRKLSAEFEKPKVPTDLPLIKSLPEKNLFPSLDPSEGQKVEEEFDKITDESKLDSLLSKEPSKLDEILKSSNVTDSSQKTTIVQQTAAIIQENKKNKSAELAEPEPDEFQDEIQFDPTISSGQLGFGDFRNTPIKLGESRSESVQPILPENFPSENFTENNYPASIEPMTPTEAEILLSSKLAEKRSSVLSDEQAEEVTALLTPDKELPPTPIGK